MMYYLLPSNMHLFKINNRNTRKRNEICSKLIIKTPKQRHWRRSSVFIKFEYISHFFLEFLLLTLSKLILVGYFHWLAKQTQTEKVRYFLKWKNEHLITQNVKCNKFNKSLDELFSIRCCLETISSLVFLENQALVLRRRIS